MKSVSVAAAAAVVLALLFTVCVQIFGDLCCSPTQTTMESRSLSCLKYSDSLQGVHLFSFTPFFEPGTLIWWLRFYYCNTALVNIGIYIPFTGLKSGCCKLNTN